MRCCSGHGYTATAVPTASQSCRHGKILAWAGACVCRRTRWPWEIVQVILLCLPGADLVSSLPTKSAQKNQDSSPFSPALIPHQHTRIGLLGSHDSIDDAFKHASTHLQPNPSAAPTNTGPWPQEYSPAAAARLPSYRTRRLSVHPPSIVSRRAPVERRRGPASTPLATTAAAGVGSARVLDNNGSRDDGYERRRRRQRQKQKLTRKRRAFDRPRSSMRMATWRRK